MQNPHAFTLEFPSPALEAGFEREYRQQPRAYYRLLALAILGFLVLISLTGLMVVFSVNREGIQRLLWTALIPLTAVAAAALHVPAVAQRQRPVVVAYVVALGLACALYPTVHADRFIAEAYGFSYAAFTLLLALAFGRLSPRSGLAFAATIIGTYSAATAATLGAVTVMQHVPLLLGATAIGFAVGYMTERSVRLVFAARALAQERESQLAESEAKLRAAQARSEELILSLLPASIAERLRTHGGAIADGIAECTVLFADLVGFSALSREIGPRALVGVLNRLFSEFDALCREHGLEKIKTIGDAYMAAAGVPDYAEDHPARAADMALAMRGVLERFNADTGMSLGVRIGLHCGPVIAGIIGTGKFAYDLWGETVNTASRMESHGASGRIQVSEAAALRLKRTHVLDERGVVELKGVGPMKTWWLLERSVAGPKEVRDGTRAGVA